MLPPDSVPVRAWMLGRADVEALDERARVAVDRVAADAPAAPVGRLADALEHEVQRDREPGDDPLAEAVVGDVAQAELLALGDAHRADRRAEVADLPAGQAALPADHLGERALPVAVDAGDAQHLAEAQRQRDVLDARLRALAAGVGVLERERDLGVRRRVRAGAPSTPIRSSAGSSAAREASRRTSA